MRGGLIKKWSKSEHQILLQSISDWSSSFLCGGNSSPLQVDVSQWEKKLQITPILWGSYDLLTKIFLDSFLPGQYLTSAMSWKKEWNPRTKVAGIFKGCKSEFQYFDSDKTLLHISRTNVLIFKLLFSFIYLFIFSLRVAFLTDPANAGQLKWYIHFGEIDFFLSVSGCVQS